MPSGSNKRDQHGANVQLLLHCDNQMNLLSSMPSGSNKSDQHGANGKLLLPNDNQYDHTSLALPLHRNSGLKLEQTGMDDYSPKELREKLASGIPFDIKEIDDHGSLPTLDDLHSKFSDFKSQLYDKENNKVGFSDFEGLQEALHMCEWGETPDYLEDIAVETETAIGKQINKPGIRVLLSAAMKDLKLERDMSNVLKKWAATLNYAKENDPINSIKQSQSVPSSRAFVAESTTKRRHSIYKEC
ncbi:hypothetical protein GQ457_06G025790 [Hibiscus cannabinus]